MSTTKKTVRMVQGLRLVSTSPGYWASETDPSVRFMHHGTTRLGLAGQRYTVERWSFPGSDSTAQSLDAAVGRYLRSRTAQHHLDLVTE